LGRNKFTQGHAVWRIKKMDAEKLPASFLIQLFSQRIDR
jgi:hypothetical protein